MKKLLGLCALVAITATFLGAATITITKPTTGDVWAKGPTYAITWTKSGAMGNLVRISLRDKDSTAEVKLIADSVTNSGSYSWQIPANTADGQYRVRVKVKNEATLGDSAIFTIGAPPPASITVTKPTTGDKWQKNKAYTVTWTKTGTMPNSVKIDLVDQSSTTVVRPIADNQPNTGAYLWTIPGEVAVGPYRVRVQVKTTAIQDDSETFNISHVLISGGQTAMKAKVAFKTSVLTPNYIRNIGNWINATGGIAIPSDLVPIYQAQQVCLKQMATAQEYESTVNVGSIHFGWPCDGHTCYGAIAHRTRFIFDVTPFMGKGADIVEARMHLTQTHSVRTNTSNASCGVSWWFLLNYVDETEAGWHNPPIDTSCHGDLHWWETDYRVDVLEAVKRWVSGNQWNYGLILFCQNEGILYKVESCDSCYKVTLEIKLKVE